MKDPIDAKRMSVGDYFKIGHHNGSLYIPYLQRKYEWREAQIKRLLQDIALLYENKKKYHILNFFTLYSSDDETYIYDGQQRTVTLSIVLCVISNLMMQYGCEEYSEIKADYITKKHFKKERITKLNFNKEELQKYYQENIIKYDEKGKKMNVDCTFKVTEEMRRLSDCYTIANKFFNDYCEGEADNRKAEILSEFAQLILYQIFLIEVIVESEETAEQMFELLNNTGKELEALYVVKSICVNLVGEEETKKRWEDMEFNLEELKKDDFLTQFVSIFNRKPTQTKVVEVLKNLGMLNDGRSVIQTLEQMRKVSRSFLFLNRPDRGLYEWNDKNLKKKMDNLYKKAEEMRALKGKQYMPIIHAMYLYDFNIDHINTVFDWLIKLHIRNITLGGDNPNTLEKLYPELAKGLSDACKVREIDGNKPDDEFQKQQVEQIIKIIRPKIKSDEMVKNGVIIKEFTDSKIARVILEKIYEYENGTEIQINRDTTYVNLEHILPKKPDLEWIKSFGDDAETYINQLGNLTLFDSTTNSSMRNKSFDYKKSHFLNSKIPQNKLIGEYDNWNKEIIKERTEKMSEQVVKIWSI